MSNHVWDMLLVKPFNQRFAFWDVLDVFCLLDFIHQILYVLIQDVFFRVMSSLCLSVICLFPSESYCNCISYIFYFPPFLLCDYEPCVFWKLLFYCRTVVNLPLPFITVYYLVLFCYRMSFVWLQSD